MRRRGDDEEREHYSREIDRTHISAYLLSWGCTAAYYEEFPMAYAAHLVFLPEADVESNAFCQLCTASAEMETPASDATT